MKTLTLICATTCGLSLINAALWYAQLRSEQVHQHIGADVQRWVASRIKSNLSLALLLLFLALVSWWIDV